MLATAAAIPMELYDLILDFFRLDPDGNEDWITEDEREGRGHSAGTEERREWGRRNLVLVNKHELGWLALVGRQWARLCQPKIFQEVALRNRDDVESLLALLAEPKCRIAEYIQAVELSHSVAIYPYPPWIHTVLVRLVPKLRLFKGVKEMTLTGPLPVGQPLRSIHSVLPIRYPQFASGISHLFLKDLHFKSFSHLVQLLKELPSLHNVDCENVTWNSSPDAVLPVATSYVGRDVGSRVEYQMTGCTDNAAAMWLTWLLAPKLSSRLEQQESDALCHIASSLVQNVDATRFPDCKVVSNREEDHIYFYASSKGQYLTPRVQVFLTSAVPPGRTRRRVRAVELGCWGLEASSVVGWDCWPAVDTQLATLHSLQTVLLYFDSHDDLILFARNVITSKMPALQNSAILKYAHYSNGGSVWYTPDMIDSKDNGRGVRYLDDIL